ncbi:meiosis arrest female protein 1 [Tanacetum coccineum]
MAHVISVYWDLENCCTTSESLYRAAIILKREVQLLLPMLPILECKVYVNKTSVTQEPRKSCDLGGFTLVDAPAGTIDASNIALIVDLYRFALDHPPLSYIFLISDDGGFASMLATLHALGYRVALIHPHQTSQSLLVPTDPRFLFSSLCR